MQAYPRYYLAFGCVWGSRVHTVGLYRGLQSLKQQFGKIMGGGVVAGLNAISY